MIFLASKLKYFREKAGYSQRQISELLGCERSTYTYYEIGRTRPDITVLGSLCKILGIKYEQLITEDDGSMVVCDNAPSSEDKIDLDTKSEKIYELSKNEKELVAYFRLMSEKQKAKLLEKLNVDNKKNSKFNNKNN